MKRVVAVVISVVFVVNCPLRFGRRTQPQQEPGEQISEVIVIDPEERERLGLFPGIEGFKEARCNVTSGYGYEVEIVTETERLVSVNDDQDAAVILYDYINNYEEIEYARASFEARWGIIDYDALGFPITRSQVAREVTPGHAVACGLAGCFGVGGVGGLLIGIYAANTVDEDDEYRGLSIAAAAICGGVAAGLLAGCVTGFGMYERDKTQALERIKESRKPRLVE